MTLKSYFALSVEEAIQRARLELGSEAMLLNSRKIAPEQSQLGAYEVVFGITGEMLQFKPAPNARPSSFAAALASRSAAASASPSPAPILIPPPAAPAPVLTAASRVDLPVEPVATIPMAAGPQPTKRQNRKAKAAAGTGQPKPASERVRKAANKGDAPALADELASLCKQIQAVQHSLSGSGQGRLADKAAPDEETYQRLIGFDFSDRAARCFVAAAATLARSDSGETPSHTRLAHALAIEINSRFDVSPRVGRESSDRRIVMFVGPPGAGKTTTIVKLAVKLGIQRRIPVQLLSLDTMRVGGSEQLGEYARILGVDFRAIYTAAALDEVLQDCAGKKLVLIDTPGYAPAETEEAEENAYFLRRHPEIEVQLVLPASLRTSALDKFSERFAVFEPAKLVFTHLDEVDSFGPLIEHAMTTKLPISFLTDGQTVPADIEEASKERLTEGLFQQLASEAIPAA